MTLAAWGLKRIDDMTRDDLIVALNALHQSYTDVLRANMSPAALDNVYIHPRNEHLEFWDPHGTYTTTAYRLAPDAEGGWLVSLRDRLRRGARSVMGRCGRRHRRGLDVA